MFTFQHFVGGQGPTEEWPDPLPADGSQPTKPRRALRRCFPDGRQNVIVKRNIFFCSNFRTILFADFLQIHDVILR